MATKVTVGIQEYELTDKEAELIKENRKIDAIKELRFRLNLGLKEAKDIVVAYADGLPTSPITCRVCKGLGKVLPTAKSFCSDGHRGLLDFKLGERYSYINDYLFRDHKVLEQTRMEISKELAHAMAGVAGYEGDIHNKDFVCVNASELSDKRAFVYFHDFSYYLYIVWPKG